LGKVVIADNLDDAIRIARKNNNSFRIVTLDGQVLNAGGSMTGGSASGNTGILSRANELVQLTAQEKNLEEPMLRVEREYNEAVRDKNAAEYELETSNAEIRAIEDKVLKLETNLKHFKLLLDASEGNLNALKAETAALTDRINNNVSDTETAREEITTLEDQLSGIREQIVKDTQGQEFLASERDDSQRIVRASCREDPSTLKATRCKKPSLSCPSCQSAVRASPEQMISFGIKNKIE
jgi:chromosome segregation protein